MILPGDHPAAAYMEYIDKIAERLRLDPLLLVAVGAKESGWGHAPGYNPLGPGGAGDRAPRPRKRPPADPALRRFYNGTHLGPPVWSNGAIGFGLGLMQIDAEFHWDWARRTTPDGIYLWANPAANIARGAMLLRGYLDTFRGNPRAGVAAYNAGRISVHNAIDHGQDPDTVTTHGNYASDVLAKYLALGGEPNLSHLC